jgi:hypothetical protein
MQLESRKLKKQASFDGMKKRTMKKATKVIESSKEAKVCNKLSQLLQSQRKEM